MTNLINKQELQKRYKDMTKGQRFYKCSLAIFWANDIDFETYGYAITNNIEEAKRMFLKELEDDEEATINAYMVIWPVEYKGKYTSEDGKTCYAKGLKSEAIINDFGTWKTFKQFCNE